MKLIKPITPDRLLRQREPYHFQRPRASIHSNYPRPSQPNTSQPNQKVNVQGTDTMDYWNNVYKGYLSRRGGGSQSTNLALGRL